jgi:dienelactone hydrolase
MPRHIHSSRLGPVRARTDLRVLALLWVLLPASGAAVAAQDTAPTPSPVLTEVAGPFASGASVVQVEIDGTELDLYVYKPEHYVGDGFVLLLHGASRAAEAYRDNAAEFADTYGRLVVVPLFDRERFPNRLYQFGGVFREDGSFADAEERTYRFIPQLVEHIRQREGGAELPYVILGYSAGAQFVARMSAFMDLDAERLIAMSPGSTLFTTRDMDFGLGFGGLPDEFGSDERIRRYLALPLTVAIGTADREMAQLPQGDAYDQGVHRYSRNLRWFNEAMDLAFQNEWEFNWRLVIFHGAGHPPVEMFHHPQIGNALFGHRESASGVY